MNEFVKDRFRRLKSSRGISRIRMPAIKAISQP
jgi:hypothetical protein